MDTLAYSSRLIPHILTASLLDASSLGLIVPKRHWLFFCGSSLLLLPPLSSLSSPLLLVFLFLLIFLHLLATFFFVLYLRRRRGAELSRSPKCAAMCQCFYCVCQSLPRCIFLMIKGREVRIRGRKIRQGGKKCRESRRVEEQIWKIGGKGNEIWKGAIGKDKVCVQREIQCSDKI